jgi:hypothetical protein
MAPWSRVWTGELLQQPAGALFLKNCSAVPLPFVKGIKTSMYQAPPAVVQHSAQPLGRPTTLTAAVAGAFGVAVLNIVGAAAILASGTEMVRQQIAQNPGLGSDHIDPSTVDLGSERARGLHTMFTSFAADTIFWSLVLAVLAYFALRGGRTTRIVSAVILGITALVKLIDLVFEVPTVTLIADVLAALVAIAAIVLFFLPASNAYGRSRRTTPSGAVPSPYPQAPPPYQQAPPPYAQAPHPHPQAPPPGGPRGY